MSDTVYLRNAALLATVGLDCWHRNKPQPVLVSLRMKTDIKLAGENDDVLETINYGNIYQAVVSELDASSFPNLESITLKVGYLALVTGGGTPVTATVLLPKALLHAGGVGYEATLAKDVESPTSKILFVKDWRLSCVIGVNKHERGAKQVVVTNLKFHDVSEVAESDYQGSLNVIQQHIEASIYLTLEAFVTSIAKIAIEDLGFSKATISAEKPNAYGRMDCPGVEITRTKDTLF